MIDLLNYTICSGLGFPIFNKVVDKNKIPDNCFGAFVSVKRSQKLNEWPEDIHGCIGNWDNNYKNLEKKRILEIIGDVSYKATNNDNRKNYFETIYKDAYSTYEIDFMLLPKYKITSNTGKFIKDKNTILFNNNEYGLIVSGNTRATYLPKVFEKENWESIKKKIEVKSGSRNGNNKFYAYEAKIISKQIYKIFNKQYLNNYLINYLKFIKNKYQDFVPYEYNKNNDEIIVNREQYVRNIATIYDILIFNKKVKILDNKFFEKINRDLDYYVELYKKSNYQEEMRQASAFLILALNIVDKKKYKYSIETISKNLYKNINILEENFELCEVLIALNEVNPSKFRVKLLKQQKEIFDKLKQEKEGDNIFKYNWQSKFLYSLSKNKDIKTNKKAKERINEHRNLLLTKIIQKILTFNEKTETNYLAVSIEALSSLLKINKSNKKKIMNNILYLFSELNKRYDIDNGLYKFSSGSSRLDITGHVLNGLILF